MTILLAMILSFSSLSSWACPISSELLASKMMSIAKKNKSSVNPLRVGLISESEFNAVVTKIRAHFTPIFKSHGLDLSVHSDWNYPMFNAFATEDAKGRHLYFFGEFTRIQYMTLDSFLFVACHEVGHHLGGFPKNKGSMAWASLEGQADYYGASKCFRELLKNDEKNLEAEKLPLAAKIKEVCRDQHAADEDYQICLRAASTAENIAKIVYYMNTIQGTDETFLENAEPAPVSTTSYAHPSPTCRAQTILQASQCNRPSDIEISNEDETIGVCHERNGDLFGSRAKCWFKSKADEATTNSL